MTLTAQAAFHLYERAFNADALIQGSWHEEQNGRQLSGVGIKWSYRTPTEG